MAAPNTPCSICGRLVYRRPCHQGMETVCSRACKSVQTERQFTGKPSPFWRPFCTPEELRADYTDANMSTDEVAEKWCVSRKMVSTALRKYGIPRRRQIKRDQWGEKNASWSGASIGYKGAHDRVNRVRGQPQECERCGFSGPGRRYDWASISRNYHDPSDYRRLCRECHVAEHGLVNNLGPYKGGKGAHWRRDRKAASPGSLQGARE